MSLRDRLVARIEAEGPLTFAEFMEAALYDPDEGFYARPAIGEDGHFVTSPHVSPAFGDLLARQVAQIWEVLGRPSGFTVLEVGAGDGTLAGQILEAVGTIPELARSLRYVAVERTAGSLDALRERGLDAVGSVRGVGAITGCVLGNEVLDNLPFHRLRRRHGRVVEVMVGSDGDRLIEVEAQPSDQAASFLDGLSGADREHRVSPAADELVRHVAGVLRRGYSFFFDYAGPGPVHGYRGHRPVADVLEDPGSRDVTASVDFGAVATEARRAGLQVWGPVGQREALLALGYRLWTSGVRHRQAEAERGGDWRAAGRLYQARSRASILIDQAKLGGLQLLALGTDGLPPPAAVLGDRAAGC